MGVVEVNFNNEFIIVVVLCGLTVYVLGFDY